MSESDLEIDPLLDDPSMKFLQNLPDPHSTSPFSQTTGEERRDNDEEELPRGPSSIHSQGPSGEPSGPGIEAPASCPSFDFPEICRMVKKRKRLTPESEAELDRFCAPVRVCWSRFVATEWN
jgi:hypothetical protein